LGFDSVLDDFSEDEPDASELAPLDFLLEVEDEFPDE
jgi:hypothetical protein